MEYKLFHTPRHHDEAWYVDREAADHIHQEGGHRMRLLEAKELVRNIFRHDAREDDTLADWGAGNGGLLSELRNQYPGGKMWGYDLCPQNVEFGISRYGLDLKLMNVVTGAPAPADVVILTEFLEHLVDPHEIIERLFRQDTRWLVASVPGFETPASFYEFHLWCWTGESFAQMFEQVGWKVRRHFAVPECGTQFLVASR